MNPPGYEEVAAAGTAYAVGNPQDGVMSYLAQHAWPLGLQSTLLQRVARVPYRFFIVDDSGSMSTNDGSRLVGRGAQSKLINCTRWAELTEAIRFHAGLANVLRVPTEFRLLNGAAPVTIGAQDSETQFSILNALLDGSPSGGTPLCRHIREVTQRIRALEPQLRASGQKAALIIATDGESSDGDIAAAMKPLEGLPVQVIIRLCTDAESIVSYWNGIDAQLEIEIDVLDDLVGEAQEIAKVNQWLTYGEPLHRFRELGLPVKELDIIDEAKLSGDQLRLVCSMLFGCPSSQLPHPDVDFDQFLARVRFFCETPPATVAGQAGGIGLAWDPITKGLTTWINIPALVRMYGPQQSAAFPSYPPQQFPGAPPPQYQQQQQQQFPGAPPPQFQQQQYPTQTQQAYGRGKKEKEGCTMM